MNIYFVPQFLKGHPRAGEPTNFAEKILNGEKVHTIRCPKNIAQLENTLQKCEVKLISGSWRKPGEVIKQLKGVSTQRVIKDGGLIYVRDMYTENIYTYDRLAINDGLTDADFIAWFENVPDGKEMLLIHFGDNQYCMGNYFNDTLPF